MRRCFPVLCLIAILAGCGGGGGASGAPSTIPTTAPGTSDPSPSPGHSPSPSASPVVTPTAIPSGVPTTAPSTQPSTVPTVRPTASPTAAPTPVPTQPPTPTPTATPDTATPSWNGQTVTTTVSPQPVVNGTVAFNPAYDDTPSGGQGAAFNNDLQCDPSMSNNYHIHVFVGLYVNGQEVILPRGIGIVNPNPNDPPDEEIDYATNCFYYTHTHDSTGIVHVEDPNPNGTLITQPIHTMADIFTVWGITVNSNQFGPYAGPVTVFTSGQVYRGGASCSGNTPPAGTQIGNGTTPESDLTLWTGDPNAIPLYSHEVIWFLIGTNDPTSLPNVDFYEEC